MKVVFNDGPKLTKLRILSEIIIRAGSEKNSTYKLNSLNAITADSNTFYFKLNRHKLRLIKFFSRYCAV